jgi:hypothetical protein
MSNNEIHALLRKQERKLNLLYESVEKTRKYFLWTLIVTAITFVLPLLMLLIALPWVISTITSSLSL